MRSFLNGRVFGVRAEGEASNLAPAPSRVPQGSVLGALLFIIYINDLPSFLTYNSLLFADDVKLYAYSSRVADLNRDLVDAVDWASDWAMEFNMAKCNVMHFGPGIASDIVMNVNDEVHLLPAVQLVRDLGVYYISPAISNRACRLIEGWRGREESCL